MEVKKKIDALIQQAHEIIDCKDTDTAIIVLTVHNGSAGAGIGGNSQAMCRVLHYTAENNPGFKELLLNVADNLREEED